MSSVASAYGPAAYVAPPAPPPPPPPQPYQANSVPNPQPCYNCGSRQHIAQFCTEPRRQVPVGSLNQKPRPPKNNNSNKKSKPVITRYAPPPGYVPPQGRPTVNTALPAPYVQPAPYGAQPYSQTSSPATPQWQNSPQSYGVAPQWPQSSPVTPVHQSAYGPHQPAHVGPSGYGHSPLTPYPPQPNSALQSPAQGFPPQYPAPQAHPQGLANQSAPPGYYPAQHGRAHSPQSAFPPQSQAPPFSQVPASNTYAPQQPGFQQQPVPGYQPYQQSAPSTYPPFQPPASSPVGLNSPQGPPFPPPFAQSRSTHPNGHRNNHGNNNRNNHHHHNNNKGGRNKRFQPPVPAEKQEARPPSPPKIFPPLKLSTERTKGGPPVPKSPQALEKPIEPIYDENEAIQYVSSTSIIEGEDRKCMSAMKYYDAEGNPRPREKDPEEDNDPVWTSVRTDGSTRAYLDGVVVEIDFENDEVMKELKKNVLGDQKRQSTNLCAQANPQSTPTDNSKKRSFDETFAPKPSQDQDRRPSKRRQHDGRNRRGIRNNNQGRQGNRGMNRNPGPQNPPAQRSYHPLPPKPVTGLPPPAQLSTTATTDSLASVDTNAGPRHAHDDAPKPTADGAAAAAAQPSSSVNGRQTNPASVNNNNNIIIKRERSRSASPKREVKQHQQQENWRQRDYDGAGAVANDAAEHPGKLSDNADVRRYGSAAMEVYSRRW